MNQQTFNETIFHATEVNALETVFNQVKADRRNALVNFTTPKTDLLTLYSLSNMIYTDQVSVSARIQLDKLSPDLTKRLYNWHVESSGLINILFLQTRKQKDFGKMKDFLTYLCL